jgi:2-polyprenyl-3-methyl-5-hydroxy-6-metoxy-1,4-benzoquinol methylase
MPDFRKRSYEPETMDDLNMEGEELASTLFQIANVNKWLGGIAVVLDGLKKILKSHDKKDLIKIADFGCGGGEILREIAIWARKKNYKVELVGYDANAFTMEYASEQAKSFPEIRFEKLNIFEFKAKENEFDITICSLFLHHFNEEEIAQIIGKLYTSSSKAVLINDLQRSALAYYLFKFVTFTLNASKMVRNDGLLSIRKSFRKNELKSIAEIALVKNYSISWKWAFRYEVLLLKN